VEPNPLLPRIVSSKSYEGIIEESGVGEERAHLNHRYFWGEYAFKDQLGHAIALVDWRAKM
jgi:hypothetical protein